MTYKSYKSYKTYNRAKRGVARQARLIPPHGGYKKLESYKTAVIIYDGTVVFCEKWVKSWKQKEQMTGAARSGKQNIAEGSQVSGTSKKIELKLVDIARGSLEELLQDYEDFLRQRGLKQWKKDSAKAREIRQLAYKTNRSYRTYKTFLESKDPEVAANCLVILCNQANYLLDRQLGSLEKKFLEEGGFTERLYRKRKEARKL